MHKILMVAEDNERECEQEHDIFGNSAKLCFHHSDAFGEL